MIAPIPVTERSVETGSSGTNIALSTVLIHAMEILMMVTLTLYGTWVAQGLIEEKSNRVVELLLVAAKPWHLLFGKVIGVGAVALVQYLIWLATVAIAMHWHTLEGIALMQIPGKILVSFPVFFVLGYLFYATLYGMAGSVVYRIKEQQMMLAPVQLLMMVSCYVGMAVLINPDSRFSVIVSLLPMCAPLAMFARITLTTVPWWQLVVSLGLCAGSIWVLVRMGERVYRHHVLRTSGKSGWKLLFQRERQMANNG